MRITLTARYRGRLTQQSEQATLLRCLVHTSCTADSGERGCLVVAN